MDPMIRKRARVVGPRELQAFLDATREVSAGMARLQQVAVTGLTITAGALRGGDVDSALNASVAGMTVMLDGRVAVLKKFERAACNFLGERVGMGETLLEYFERLAGLNEHQLLTMQSLNGITFTTWSA
jgi:hypothetical protein